MIMGIKKSLTPDPVSLYLRGVNVPVGDPVTFRGCFSPVSDPTFDPTAWLEFDPVFAKVKAKSSKSEEYPHRHQLL